MPGESLHMRARTVSVCDGADCFLIIQTDARKTAIEFDKASNFSLPLLLFFNLIPLPKFDQQFCLRCGPLLFSVSISSIGRQSAVQVQCILPVESAARFTFRNSLH
jgi:hypothetical protein